MRTIIDSKETLQNLLLQYTGSNRIPVELEHWVLCCIHGPNKIFSSGYRTYSRGKSTMMFGRDHHKYQSFLVDVWPKMTRKAYSDGIDSNILQALMPFIKTDGIILAGWGYSLMVHLPSSNLTEKEIEHFFKLGFCQYFDEMAPGSMLIMK